MPLPGAESDKLGNHYEALWTVRMLLRILAEEEQSIYLEPFGEMGDGIEFQLKTKEGVLEYHQVKRQRPKGWNIKALASKGVLTNFRKQLERDSEAICVFVSQDQPNDLRELTESATNVEHFDQYKENYLKAKNRKDAFRQLNEIWEDLSQSQIFDLICRMRVRGIDETTLREEIVSKAKWLVEGESEVATDALYLLYQNSIHQTLDAVAIWKFLESPPRKFHRRNWNNSPLILENLSKITSLFLESSKRNRILGEQIPRQETNQIFEYMTQPDSKQFIVIAGTAGSGKSEIIAEYLEKVIEKGAVVMPFRLDRLETYGNTTKQLGEQLDLPQSPVTVLGRVADLRQSVLLIDQLDAVSLASGRNPAFFERVTELLDEARNYPQMTVVLACRTFDLENDDRIRKLVEGTISVAHPFTVSFLSGEEVDGVLEKCGIEPSTLSQAQKELLKVPLNLKLYTQIQPSSSFTTEIDLLEMFWEHKQDKLRGHISDYEKLHIVLNEILAEMTEKQALSVSARKYLDPYRNIIESLLTEGVLVLERNRLSFFHESFYDYLFARMFVANERNLLEFLLGQEQHLFLRGIVRQILTHERSQDKDLFAKRIGELLEHDSVRFHIKRLIFQWIRTLPDPQVPEWELLKKLMKLGDKPLASWAESALRAATWFSFLDAVGWIESELHCGDHDRETWAANYVAQFVREFPDRIGEIGFAWTKRPNPWPNYAMNLISHVYNEPTRTFVDTFLELLRQGNPGTVKAPFATNNGMLFYSLPEDKSEWAIEILSEWLIYNLRKAELEGILNPFSYSILDEDRLQADLRERMPKMASGAPREFLNTFLPIVLELARRNVNRMGPPPWRDTVWKFLTFNTHYRLNEQILKGVVDSLCFLAENDKDSFNVYEAELQQYLDFEIAGWILAQAYAKDGNAFAEQGADFMLSSVKWLSLGWSDSEYWISRQLIASVTPHCSLEKFKNLEKLIMNFYTKYERRNRYMGHGQLTLLSGFPQGRLSPQAIRRLDELKRRFPEWKTERERPQGIRGGFIGAPFKARWDKITDTDWLSAIAKYSDDDHSGQAFMKGGARQLSSELQKLAKQFPNRFASLIQKIPKESNHQYAEAILWGIRDAYKTKEHRDPEIALCWNAIRYCHALKGHPLGSSICDLIQECPHADIPSDILSTLKYYAVDDPSPGEYSESDFNGDAALAGLNSVRGRSASAISRILFNEPTYFGHLEPILEKMVQDPSVAVRTQVPLALLPVLNVDRDRAVQLFLQLLECQHQALLGCHHVVQFLSYAIWTHFESVEKLLSAMLNSESTAAQQHGAELLLISASSNESVLSNVQDCLNGSTSMRKGIAEVASQRVRLQKDRLYCEQLLKQLFSDDDEDVRRIASNCFHEMDAQAIESSTELIENFIYSTSFGEHSFFFFDTLKRIPAHLPDIVCKAFERSAEVLRDITASEEHRTGRFADRNTILLIRLYERTEDAEVKKRCLDIIDDLAKSQASFELDQHLTELGR